MSTSTALISVILLLMIIGVVLFQLSRDRMTGSMDRSRSTVPPEPATVKKSPPKSEPVVDDAMRELRLMALTTVPDSGLRLGPDEPYIVLMELGFDEGYATLLASAEGDASLYLSWGGGVIGGIGHQNVREAATAFVRASSNFRTDFVRTENFPTPGPDRVHFFLRTPDAVYFAARDNASLRAGHDDFRSLFDAGQLVLTQLRLIAQSSQN